MCPAAKARASAAGLPHRAPRGRGLCGRTRPAVRSRPPYNVANTRKLGLASGSSMELRVAAPELVDPVLVARRDLRLAPRQRRPPSLDRSETLASRLELAQQVEIDLDVEDLLHAAHVRVPPRLVCVDELDTRDRCTQPEYTTRSQWTSHRRHSTSSCGRSGISAGAEGAGATSLMPGWWQGRTRRRKT